jgi:hypothetical protein
MTTLDPFPQKRGSIFAQHKIEGLCSMLGGNTNTLRACNEETLHRSVTVFEQ